MPNWYPSWTQCSLPANFRGPPWAGVLTSAGVALLLGFLIGSVALGPGIAAALAVLCIGGMQFCTWWLNVRLICLGGDRSVIGVIYHLEPPVPTDNPITALNFTNGDIDTDYSFNLLLYEFVPQQVLPQSFVANQWSASAFPQLAVDWPSLPPLVPFNVPFSEVSDEVNLIVAQQSMASLGLGFGGQNVDAVDQTNAPGGSSQHFLMHCEIEGPGMHDLLVLLAVLLGVFLAAIFVYAIPVVGPILTWILTILAFLALLVGAPAITHDDAGLPSGGDWGGSVTSWDPTQNPDDLVDIVYVFGRWVYDSLHTGYESNELHPVHYMVKISSSPQGYLSKGFWPPGLFEMQLKYDAQFGVINSPATIQIQAEPQNGWKIHPLLDGCLATTPYPEPPPPGPVIV